MHMRAGLAIAGAACALAGCGADELSSEEYNARLDQVFTEFNEELPKASSELTPASSLEDRAAALAEGEPVIGNAVSDLEAIEPPPELEELHERLVALFESFGEATRDAREAAESDDPQGLLDYQKAITRFQQELAVLGQDFADAGLGVGRTATGTGGTTETDAGAPPESEPGGARGEDSEIKP
jgi:hypothetical protein